MLLFKRPDGQLATDVPPARRIMPFIMQTRNESAVYFDQQIDLTRTLPFIEQFNAAHPNRRVTVFHVFMWAAMLAIHARPRMNRFVVGSRIYQRDGIWISYSAKKALRDDAPIVVLKRQFDPTMSFEQVVDFIYRDLDDGRSEKKSHVDKELGIFLSLPAPLLRFGVWLLKLLDGWNLLPGSFIRPDPLYASLFVANLGSVKLESAYHHLYEYGSIPLFAAIGRKKEVVTPTGTQTVCSIKYSFDERIEDGLYAAGALALLKQRLEDPGAPPLSLVKGSEDPARLPAIAPQSPP
jgi:hypothetical protein